MYAIVGSGFGLYGYLPAVAEASGEPVLLPEAYREKVAARPELARYARAIVYAPTELEALQRASAVVIATPPERQVKTALLAATLPRIERIVLEKPVARDPFEAQALLEHLDRAGKRYRVAYTFLHTAWGADLAWPHAEDAAAVSIRWTFLAHHYAKGLANWKREHASGGGALRFFGVHLFALLARAGYDAVARSVLVAHAPGEAERWEATFTGPGLPPCHVHVDSRSEAASFRIATNRALVDRTDPYSAEPHPTEQDRRVGVLQRFLATFRDPDAEHRELCRRANELWRAAEEAAPR